MRADLPSLTTSVGEHYHSFSCTKYAKRRAQRNRVQIQSLKRGLNRDLDVDCRFRYPAELVYHSHVEDNGKIHLKRLCHWTVPYNPVVTYLLRCNTDIQCLFGADPQGIMYYITDYATKFDANILSQFPIYRMQLSSYQASMAAMAQDGELPPDACQKAARLLLTRIQNQFNRDREMPLQAVVANLAGLPERLSSHTKAFRKLVLWPFLQMAEEDDDQREYYGDPSVLALKARRQGERLQLRRTHDGGTQLHSDRANYVLRPRGLDHVCLYDFFSFFETISMTRAANEQKDLELKPMQFLEDHLLRDKQAVQMRKPGTEFVPVLYGPKVPRCDLHQEKYAKMALILFKPFRHASELRPDDASWVKALDSFARSELADARIQLYLDHMQAMATSQAAHDDDLEQKRVARISEVLENQRERRQSGRRAGHDRSNDNDNDMDVGNDFDPSAEAKFLKSLRYEFRPTRDPGLFMQATAARVSELRLFDTRAADPQFWSTDAFTSFHSLLASARSAGADQSPAQRWLIQPSAGTAGQLKTWRKEIEARQGDAIARMSSVRGEALRSQCAPFLSPAQLLPAANSEADSIDVRPPPEPRLLPLGENPLVKKIIDTLTLKQRLAFLMVADTLTLELQHDDNVAAKQEPVLVPQLSLYVGGSAGTGKSFLIRAIRQLFEIYGRLSWLRLSASTGTAAKGIGGRTVQSLLRIQSQKGLEESDDSDDSDGKLARGCGEVRFLIIDEISMISCRTARDIHVKLQAAKRRYCDWSGVHMLFFGDFAQFRPCGGRALYEASAEADAGKRLCNAIGRGLWSRLTAAVFLDEQKRYQGDVQWLGMLERLREGACNEQDYKLVKERVIQGKSVPRPPKDADKWLDARFLTVRNPLRTCLNFRYAQHQAASIGVPLVVVVAKDIQRHKHSDAVALNDDLRERLLHVADNRTKNLPGFLPLYPGQLLMLRENLAVELGLANGSEGILEGIVFAENERLPSQLLGGQCYYTSQTPQCLLVRFYDFDTAAGPLHGLQDRVVPILPSTVSWSFNVNKSSIALQRTQFAITPGKALTGHAAQGRTIKPAIADLNGSDFIQNGTYVLLSRVTGSEDLLLLSSFPMEILLHKPDQQFVAEMQRLRKLERAVAQVYADRIPELHAHMDARDLQKQEQQQQREREEKDRDQRAQLQIEDLVRRQAEQRAARQRVGQLAQYVIDWKALCLMSGLQPSFEVTDITQPPTYMPVIPGLHPAVVRQKNARPGRPNVFRGRPTADAIALAAATKPIPILLKPHTGNQADAVSSTDLSAQLHSQYVYQQLQPASPSAATCAACPTSPNDLAVIFRQLGCKQVRCHLPFQETRWYHEQVQFELDHKECSPEQWRLAVAALQARASGSAPSSSAQMPVTETIDVTHDLDALPMPMDTLDSDR